MSAPEFASRIEQLLSLCDRALVGDPSATSARKALQQALSDDASPLKQPSSSAYAETIRQEADRRAQMVFALDLSSAGYKAAVTGLKRHLVALLDASP
jgi:hypothetical protein